MSQLLTAFIKHEAGLRRHLARYLSREQDIDDLMQETFIKAMAAEAQTTIRAPKSYLYRVAKNLALNELARKANSATDYIADSEAPDVLYDTDERDLETVVSSKQQVASLTRAIAALPEQCRKVVILRKIEGLSFQDISLRMGISVSTAEKHSAKGLLKCAEFMQQSGHDESYLRNRTAGVKKAQEKKAKVVSIGDGQ